MQTSLPLSQLNQLIQGSYGRPDDLLGPHRIEYQGKPAVSVRVFMPNAQQVWLLDQAHQVQRPMRRLHAAGVFEGICPLDDAASSGHYQLRVANQSGEIVTMQDPYSIAPYISEFDRYLLGEGRHYEMYRRLGAQLRTVNGVTGVNFAVWAPNARAVQVVGDFNGWDGRQHAMRCLDNAGIWELFVSGAHAGQKYKYRVVDAEGHWSDRSDPMGFAAELPPRTASIVADLDAYQWQDQNWMHRRANDDPMKRPMNVYEVHLGSWQKGSEGPHGWLNYRDLAHRLVDYCKQLNFTHLELMPVSEHPFTGSWGYQTVGYYAATSRYGTPEDFMYFVDYCHRNDIGVILDWVPAHFPRDGHGLRKFDGTSLYEHDDPRQGEHPDWGTLIFNYGRNEVRNFLVSNALFWMDRYHIDGLRVDAVASMLYLDYSRKEGQWIPNRYGGRENLEAIDFLREFNREVHARHPGAVTIAEESTAWGGVSRPIDWGGLGFTFKWNMGWMNDTLRYMRHDPIHRGFHHDELTFSLIYAFTENFVLPLSHDEVVHGKGALISQMPGDYWQKFANLRLLYSYMWTHPGKKLLFMGGEIAQWHEWNHDHPIGWELLEWESHRGIQKLIGDLNRVVNENPALHRHDFDSSGFEWIDCMNRQDSILSYLRKAPGEGADILVCCNYTPVVRQQYHVGVPQGGYWREIFNSDSSIYGGSNVGNFPGSTARSFGAHGRPHSLEIHLPPLATVIFRHEG